MIDGRKLRAFREKRGVTQEMVGIRVGKSKQTVSQMERTPSVSLPIAERYLNAVESESAAIAGREPVPVKLYVRAIFGDGGSEPADMADWRAVLS